MNKPEQIKFVYYECTKKIQQLKKKSQGTDNSSIGKDFALFLMRLRPGATRLMFDKNHIQIK